MLTIMYEYEGERRSRQREREFLLPYVKNLIYVEQCCRINTCQQYETVFITAKHITSETMSDTLVH